MNSSTTMTRGIWASPSTKSFAFSLLLHSALLSVPLVMSWLGSFPVSSIPRGSGAMAIDWVEIQDVPSAPAPKPTKVMTTKEVVTAEPVESVPVVAEKIEPAETFDNPAQSAEALGAGSPSAEALTLGSPEGLSSEALKYHDELYLLFESRKNYPLAARRLNQQGEVLISMRIWANGKIDDQRVIKPSPYERLNEAALAMVRQVRQFKPLPKESGPYAYFQLPIEYSLN